MRAVVTGGAGFVGSHLCEALVARGDTVVCVDDLSTGRAANVAALAGNKRFRLVEHDVSTPFEVDGRVDAVAHLASPASPVDYHARPLQTLAVGSCGTEHCLQLALRNDARFVLASTSEVYGDPLQHPQTEDYWGNVNPIGTRSCYDEGKRAAETLFFDYRRQHDLSIKVIRIFNTYGPRMHPNDGRVVSNFIVQALRGEPITIYGDGSQTRSFCFVDDLVDGMVRLMNTDHEVTGPINVGNPGEFTMLELANAVLEITGSTSTIEHRPLPQDDPKQRQPNIDLARRELGWEPTVALRPGLERTIDYFRGVLADA